MRQIWKLGAVAALAGFWGVVFAFPAVPEAEHSVRAGAAESGQPVGALSAAVDGGTSSSAGDGTVISPELRSDPQTGSDRVALAEDDFEFGLGLELAVVSRVWELDGEPSYLFDHPIGDYRPTRYGLRLDPDILYALEVGDPFAMPLPGLGEVEATVSWVNEAENGDRGIGAVIDGTGDEYALTLTLGERALFGQISTADGRFLVEGVGGSASIFRDDLEQVLVDPNQTDQMIPPEDMP